jgi:hypothetical protein
MGLPVDPKKLFCCINQVHSRTRRTRRGRRGVPETVAKAFPFERSGSGQHPLGQPGLLGGKLGFAPLAPVALLGRSLLAERPAASAISRRSRARVGSSPRSSISLSVRRTIPGSDCSASRIPRASNTSLRDRPASSGRGSKAVFGWNGFRPPIASDLAPRLGAVIFVGELARRGRLDLERVRLQPVGRGDDFIVRALGLAEPGEPAQGENFGKPTAGRSRRAEFATRSSRSRDSGPRSHPGQADEVAVCFSPRQSKLRLRAWTA